MVCVGCLVTLGSCGLFCPQLQNRGFLKPVLDHPGEPDVVWRFNSEEPVDDRLGGFEQKCSKLVVPPSVHCRVRRWSLTLGYWLDIFVQPIVGRRTGI